MISKITRPWSRCYLRNRSEVNCHELGEAVRWLNAEVETRMFPSGFFEELYAPRDERRIKKSDRVFYTRGNARRLDNFRRLLDELPAAAREMLLGPLLSEASIHANTAGVFKGFYKDRKTGIGRFGGSNADALTRIRGTIELGVPVLSRHECDIEVRQEDANAAARAVHDIDLAYLDPPYNQHPYGSNYFMLNLLVHYRRPGDISQVSGIPTDWRRSGYNVRSKSMQLMHDLLHAPGRQVPTDFVQRRGLYYAIHHGAAAGQTWESQPDGYPVQCLPRQPEPSRSRYACD